MRISDIRLRGNVVSFTLTLVYLMAVKIMKGTYAWASSYPDFWMRRCHRRGFDDLYGTELKSGAELARLLKNVPWLPEILLIGNFPADRQAIRAAAVAAGINVVHSEDGFFPHYETLHADPLGFCWESSIPGMQISSCSERQRQKADATRCAILTNPPGEIPPCIRKPYVLWPLQLIADQVNVCDLNVKSWAGLIRHFRGALPAKYQLVIKQHPRAELKDEIGLHDLAHQLPNTLMVSKTASLPALLRECSAVAGANSTVLHEARLIYHKPVYAYARSWFTNHAELIFPISQKMSEALPHFEIVEDNRLLRTERLDAYADWYLAQLLARQISRETAQTPSKLREWVLRLSYHSYLKYGEEIFLNC